MSVHSSSASWSAHDARPADIIDLDKFMRGGVRPSRPETRLKCEQLVVDAGGASRNAATIVPGGACSSSGSSARPQPHAKRFSHDSGLSDGSYARRRHRPHRRTFVSENGISRTRELTSARTLPNRGSSNSFRAFRAVCERALLDQQQQIARVAQLCERLTERRTESRRERTTTDSSEVSSSSRSSRDQRRKDKHRTEECKTYKIIMTKLDELNKLFLARAQAGGRVAPPAPRRATPSSGSVSVSDKLVSTEPQMDLINVEPSRRGDTCIVERAEVCSVTRRTLARGAHLRAVTNTCDLDIAPCEALPCRKRPNVATESVVQNIHGGSGTSAYEGQCKFDLEDPIHLYTQAKKLQGLQAMPATTRRARSVEQLLSERLANRLEGKLDSRLGSTREVSLCALCRGYWRTVRDYVAVQIFGCPR